MSAARARRRLMAFERYRRHALELGAKPSMAVGSSDGHATAYWRAQRIGRSPQTGIRWNMWTIPGPRCLALVAGPFEPIMCGFPAGPGRLCRRCRSRLHPP